MCCVVPWRSPIVTCSCPWGVTVVRGEFSEGFPEELASLLGPGAPVLPDPVLLARDDC